MSEKYSNVSEFYPFYLSQHSNITCRRLHWAGSFISIQVMLFSLASGHINLLIAVPFLGYGFAWVGHFFYEKNKPATFKHPVYSIMCDFKMFWDIMFGDIDI